jgi:hypothetical protein
MASLKDNPDWQPREWVNLVKTNIGPLCLQIARLTMSTKQPNRAKQK